MKITIETPIQFVVWLSLLNIF